MSTQSGLSLTQRPSLAIVTQQPSFPASLAMRVSPQLTEPFLDGRLGSDCKILPGKASTFHVHMENVVSWHGDLPPSQTLTPHAYPLRPSQSAVGCFTTTCWESLYLDLFLPLHVRCTLPQDLAKLRASQFPDFGVLALCR